MKGKSLEPAGLRARLAERFAALFGETERPHEPAEAQRNAEFAARMAADCPLEDSGPPSGWALADTERLARLAVWLDGKPGAQGNQFEAAAAPAALEEALSSLSFIEDVVEHPSYAPADRVDAVIATWLRTQGGTAVGAERAPSRRHQRKRASGPLAPMADSFLLLAAADGTRESAIFCQSQSGLWTLEVFVETSEHGGQPSEGYLLLSVHPDHRMTYEGRTARVFVVLDGAEQVLVDARVRGGEVYARISLSGLDLWTRDAINVVFSARQDES
jgi:hypothetical protein